MTKARRPARAGRLDEERLSALNEISSLMIQTLDVEQVLASAVEKVAEVMRADIALIFRVEPRSQTLELIAHRGVSPGFVAAVDGMAVGEGFNGWVAATAEPTVVTDTAGDPRLRRPEVVNEGISAQGIVPLMAKGRVIGTLCVGVRSRRRFRPGDMELLTTIGNSIGIALENAYLYAQEKRMRENMVFFLQQAVKAQEEERKRIARDLHDDTAQVLGSISRQLDNFLRKNDRLSPRDLSFLQELRQQVNRGLKEVHRFSQDLRPSILDDLGLLPALRALVGRMQEHHDTDTMMKVTGKEKRFPPEVELSLYRIVQEALSNVRKHARATRAEVVVDFQDERTRVTISDNGQGLGLEAGLYELPRSGKLGLAGIQERVNLLGGTLEIDSSPGRGTTLVVDIPG